MARSANTGDNNSYKMKANDVWEKLFKERVLSTLNGTSEYESLTKADIDALVSAFKELQEKVDVQ